MTIDARLPEFHPHFEGDGRRGHTVPATALMQALARSIALLAIACGGQATKQRLCISDAMERKRG